MGYDDPSRDLNINLRNPENSSLNQTLGEAFIYYGAIEMKIIPVTALLSFVLLCLTDLT